MDNASRLLEFWRPVLQHTVAHLAAMPSNCNFIKSLLLFTRMSRRFLRPACLLALLCLQCAAAARDPFAGYQQEERGTLVEADRLVFNTIFGPIPVKLYREAAPQTTNLLIQLATEQGCKNCHFYRNEAKPWVRDLSSSSSLAYYCVQGDRLLSA